MFISILAKKPFIYCPVCLQYSLRAKCSFSNLRIPPPPQKNVIIHNAIIHRFKQFTIHYKTTCLGAFATLKAPIKISLSVRMQEQQQQ